MYFLNLGVKGLKFLFGAQTYYSGHQGVTQPPFSTSMDASFGSFPVSGQRDSITTIIYNNNETCSIVYDGTSTVYQTYSMAQ